ncbi:MAG: amidase family protein [Hyphomicrobiales bacterium]
MALTSGPIRNPAHYCGVYGHKPSYGIVPYKGHLMPGSVSISDITVAGPMARSASDLVAMMALIAGPDGAQARGWQLKLPKPRITSLKDVRVAIKLDSPVSEVDKPYREQLIALGEFLKKKVKALSYVAEPGFSDQEVYENYITLLRATATKRMIDADIAAAAEKARGFAPDDTGYVALMTRAFGLSHGAWLRANERRAQMGLQWEAFFEDWDVMLCPVGASAAWPHDHIGERHERVIPVNGKMVSTIDQRFWAGYGGNFYLPGTVAPIGLVPHAGGAGLPVGVQIIARHYDDATALRMAELIEQDYFRFTAPPGMLS